VLVAGEKPDIKESYEVVGVARDIKYEQLREDTLKTAYFPTHQDKEPRPGGTFELRLNQPAAQVLPAVRAAFGEVDKNISIQIRSLERQVSDSLIQPRLVAILAAFFGLVALVLAATGLYGIIAYAVVRRRAEIGLRIALGARYSSVLWLVLRDVAVMMTLGAAIGLTASRYLTKLVESLIFGVKPTDPALLTLAIGVLATAAAIAAYIPARRAARMDPMDALRTD
jgi:ABC-type lipoprotein release transport system permease subunit